VVFEIVNELRGRFILLCPQANVEAVRVAGLVTTLVSVTGGSQEANGAPRVSKSSLRLTPIRKKRLSYTYSMKSSMHRMLAHGFLSI
jgi:hypothetical protein